MTDPIDNLQESHRIQIAQALTRLRRNLADGNFLRDNLYTVDDSRLAGNTHHYWIRFGLDSNPERVFKEFLSDKLPDHISQWVTDRLDRRILQRLPHEYSTLIKIPFSVGLGQVADERSKQTDLVVQKKLPAAIPCMEFHLQINRLLRQIGHPIEPPSEPEVEPLFTNLCRNAIAKGRARFPEVWDELRGHYVLDSRGFDFAKTLVLELKERELLNESCKFIDIGSGVGTNVFAVNHYSAAEATGIEIHHGLAIMSRVLMRRLFRVSLLKYGRIDFVLGDVFENAVKLKQFDVLYVYSPIGKWEIDIDLIVDRARVGAVIIFNRLPVRNRVLVEPLEMVAGLYAFRKMSEN